MEAPLEKPANSTGLPSIPAHRLIQSPSHWRSSAPAAGRGIRRVLPSSQQGVFSNTWGGLSMCARVASGKARTQPWWAAQSSSATSWNIQAAVAPAPWSTTNKPFWRPSSGRLTKQRRMWGPWGSSSLSRRMPDKAIRLPRPRGGTTKPCSIADNQHKQRHHRGCAPPRSGCTGHTPAPSTGQTTRRTGRRRCHSCKGR